jgi:acyl carrier protein
MTGTEVASPDDEALLLAVVRELVVERYTVDRAASATLGSAFDRDLGLDSLAVAELVARVENTFGISLDPGVLATTGTPRDLLAGVRRVGDLRRDAAIVAAALLSHGPRLGDRVGIMLPPAVTISPVSPGYY